MTRRPDYQDLFAALVAFAAFLLVWLLITWLTPEPAPSSPSGGASNPDPDRAQRADPVSRGADRSVPPSGLARVIPPEPTHDRAAPVTVAPAGKQELGSGGSGWLTNVVRCIRTAESGGNYRAYNQGSGAAGAWQFISSTWESVTGLPAPASAYPRRVQDAAFRELWAGGAGAHNWVTAAGCGA